MEIAVAEEVAVEEVATKVDKVATTHIDFKINKLLISFNAYAISIENYCLK